MVNKLDRVPFFACRLSLALPRLVIREGEPFWVAPILTSPAREFPFSITVVAAVNGKMPL